MKTFLPALCVIAGLCANAQQIPKGLTAANNKFIGFYEYKPSDYNSDPSRKYPVIIFLHGIGERGNGTTELPKLTDAGIPKYIKSGKTMRFFWNGKWETFIVLSPQLSASYGSWPNFYVEEMIKYANENLQIDPNRIILTGLSLGGGGVWLYSSESAANAGKLAAIGTVCGTLPSAVKGCSIANANLPVWSFHATDDNVVAVSSTHNAISKIQACNPAVIPYKTIWPSGRHGIWDRAYEMDYKSQNPNIFEWFLAQDKSLPVNKRPKADVGKDLTVAALSGSITVSGAASFDNDGSIVRCIWRTISGPTVPAITTPVSTKGLTGITGLSSGTYEFELKAVDDRADYTLDTLTVSVVNSAVPNIPPVTEAGEDQVTMSTRADLKGSDTYDADGFVVSYKWSFLDGPNQYTLSNPNNADAEVFNLGTGTYRFLLEATDNLGAKSNDTVTISETSFVLRVNLGSFKGRTNGKVNELEWTTISEYGNDYFEIERSNNSKSFISIGRIRGADSSSTTRVYNYTDADPVQPVSFYRLKQVDKNGRIEYSDVIRIQSNYDKAVIQVFPVPSHKNITVQVSGKNNGGMNIRLINLAGKLVKQWQHYKPQESISVQLGIEDIPAGMYFLEVVINNQIVETKKIIKQ